MNGWLVLSVVASGGAAAVIRYLIARLLPVRPGGLPGGVLLVNVAGSLIGGVVLGLAERSVLTPELGLILLTGVCGGLTTFSTWTVESVELAGSGRWRTALVNVGATLVLGLGACAGGYLLAR